MEMKSNKCCSKCKNIQSVDVFYKCKASSDGYSSYCNDCSRQSTKRYVNNQRMKQNKTFVEYKKCFRCKETKVSTLYNIDLTKHDNLSSSCRDCCNLYNKTYRLQKIEYFDKYNKQYYLDHQDVIKKENKEYYLKHKDELRPKVRLYEKHRLKTDVIYRMKRYISDNIRKSLKKGFLIKNNKTETYLGCTIDFLKQHLESKFTQGMSWHNYGEWHIDHKKPCASFDLSTKEGQCKCFHYSNLQPLWAIDNITKNSIYEGKRYFYKK